MTRTLAAEAEDVSENSRDVGSCAGFGGRDQRKRWLRSQRRRERGCDTQTERLTKMVGRWMDGRWMKFNG